MSKRRTKAPVTWELGTAVEKVTTVTGIKSLVKHMAGEDCGCDERKEKLNEWSANIQQKINGIFKRPVQTLTPEEYAYLDDFFTNQKGSVKISQQYQLLKINNRVFSQKLQYSTCGSCVISMVNQLRTVYQAYTVPTE
jgi:hypothetical protein